MASFYKTRNKIIYQSEKLVSIYHYERKSAKIHQKSQKYLINDQGQNQYRLCKIF